MVDPKMVKWINASINKYFDENRNGIKLCVEGEKPPVNQLKWAELRVTGPRYIEQSKDCHKYEIDVNLLVSVKMDGQDTYAPHKVSGQFVAAMNAAIPVRKYGDDNDFIGCLILRDDVSNAIDTLQYGILDASTNVYQTGIDGFYRMEI